MVAETSTLEEVKIENHTGYPLVALYLAPTSRPAWGTNLLQKELFPSDVWKGRIYPQYGYERYFDVLAIDTDGDKYLQSGLDFWQSSHVILTFEDFLEPRKEEGDAEEYFEEYGNESEKSVFYYAETR
ncbi:MAG: hypothetical protein SNJ78_08575 [Spirochaetales bacterium]